MDDARASDDVATAGAAADAATEAPPAGEPPRDASNAVIAAAFDELSDLYELDGAIVHRVLAYRNAAKAVREAPVSVAGLARAGRVTELAGIGKTLEQKILDLLDTGTIPAAEKLRARFPSGLIQITRLPGLGPKRARRLFDELGIDSLESLEQAARAHQLRAVRGFGPKFEESVLAALEAGAGETTRTRVLLPRALQLGTALVDSLRARAATGTVIELAGSVRRQTDSVKDLDVIIAADDASALLDGLSDLDVIESASRVSAAGARAVMHNGLAVEVRAAAPHQLGNLLQHLTGSGRHNAALRERAVRGGLHVSEYGVLDDATGVTHHCATEAEVYELLGLAYIEPELREDRGEIEAAARGELPQLVTVEDIRGELHCHTVASDGRNTIDEMALAARDRGYEYIAITDHSASHGFGNDVSPDELRRQIERVHAADARIEGIRVLAGSEVNILADGSLDYDDELLASLDWVIASVHTAFAVGEGAMTQRMVTAMEHPLVDAIGHPTGRLIERREPYAVAVDELIAAAARTHTMLEVNANPDRRDLSDLHARAAAAAGVAIVIDSDAHGTERLANVRWGIATARRAWLTAADVANTRTLEELQKLRKRNRG